MQNQNGIGESDKKTPLVVDAVFEQILDRIITREWAVGFTLASERDLIEEFGVSRGALREAILRLRTLGVLRVARGKRSVVTKMDSSILGRLFPLIMAMEGEQTFQHVFEARLLIEMETVRLAATRRSDEDLRILDALLEEMSDLTAPSSKDWARKDFSIHLQIARASQNLLYEPMLKTLSGYLTYIQTIGIEGYPQRKKIAHDGHLKIVQAIRDQNVELAESGMEAHIRSGANHIIAYHLLNHSGDENTDSNKARNDDRHTHRPRFSLDHEVVKKELSDSRLSN